MNASKLRSKRIVIPTVAAAAVIGAGAIVWSSAASDGLQGDQLDRASRAAIDAVGGGRVTDSEQGDDAGEAYEIEVTKDDGSQVDVALDENYRVVSQDADDDTDESRGEDAETDDADGRDDAADDRALPQAERAAAEKAALAAVGSGTVTDVEASDDRGGAYEVEVAADDGTEWTVELDARYQVIEKRADD